MTSSRFAAILLALQARQSFSFSVSRFLEFTALALGWVIVSATLGFYEKPRPIYDAEIRPYERKIVWYHLQARVPNVRPVEAKLTPKPPRAVRKLDQESGSRWRQRIANAAAKGLGP